jgi:elongation factor P
MDGTLYQVLEVQHIKIGRGSAQVRMKLRDIRGGHIIERTVQSGARFSRARVERQPAQYMYSEGDLHYFMNTETFDQFPLNGDYLGDALNYLKENATCDLLMYGNEPVGIELSAAVELAVARPTLGEGRYGEAARIAKRNRHHGERTSVLNGGLVRWTRSGEYLGGSASRKVDEATRSLRQISASLLPPSAQ